jgi:hypothetical protein
MNHIRRIVAALATVAGALLTFIAAWTAPELGVRRHSPAANLPPTAST